MKRVIPLALLSLSIGLVACTPGAKQADKDLMANPLFAQWYYEQLQQNMMTLQIQNSPLLMDMGKRKIVAETLKDATQKAQQVTEHRRKGTMGSFRSVDQGLLGTALLLDDRLYLSPDFSTIPGPSLHLYLSTMLDPREGSGSLQFPEKGSIDLGVLRNPYGVDAYLLSGDLKDIRTAVLYDTKLESIFGFAQLQVQ